MRILLINPNSTAVMTRMIGEAARAAAATGTEIEARHPVQAPPAIETRRDEARAAAAMLDLLDGGAAKTADAVAVACFGDPGLGAVRESLPVPVTGIAEAAMLLACTTGGSFAILVAAEPARPMLAELVRSYGLAERLASVRAIGVNVLDIAADPYACLPRVLDRVREAVRRDGASAVLLGCASLAPLAPTLTVRAGVPVIDGVAAAVKTLEARVTMNTLAGQEDSQEER